MLERLRVDVKKNGEIVHEVINGSRIDEELYTDPKVGASVLLHLEGDSVTLVQEISELGTYQDMTKFGSKGSDVRDGQRLTLRDLFVRPLFYFGDQASKSSLDLNFWTKRS
ncbi:hypothetical protein V5799_014352 [Amblyomma americanum]|uniref:Uncharacterized protein n=1 Tax=Amblyomma americanum TaxID=6943 RepID=A0AAQ4E3B4_AMBAM